MMIQENCSDTSSSSNRSDCQDLLPPFSQIAKLTNIQETNLSSEQCGKYNKTKDFTGCVNEDTILNVDYCHVNRALCEIRSIRCKTGFKIETSLENMDISSSLHKAKCIPIECQCENGQVADFCTFSGQQKCKEDMCHNRYKFNTQNELCEIIPCVCSLGTPRSGLNCYVENEENCQDCNLGYDLNETVDESRTIGNCIKAVCTCHQGAPAVTGQEGCLTMGMEACNICNTGYMLESITRICSLCDQENGYYEASSNPLDCQIKVCACENGPGETGTQCREHGAHDCQSCNPGRYLLNESVGEIQKKTCQPNVCSCQNGEPADSLAEGCATHNTEVCRSCDDNFYLDVDSTCQPIICTDSIHPKTRSLS